MLPDQSLAEKIVEEMSVRYAKDGLKVSDVIELADDDEDEEFADHDELSVTMKAWWLSDEKGD